VDFGAGTRWTLYPPLRTDGHSGLCVDFVIFRLHLAGISSILGGINFICTIVNIRDVSVSFENIGLFV
jgi:heme/copper-type cytochrome/quinol oxidase subunit 1